MCLLLVVRDDPDAVEILHSDLQRLAPLEFLNDTLIDFYIKYDSLSPTSLLQKNLLCKAKSTSFLLQMKGLTISNLEYTQL
jgi:Ulp1 family protease